jgi:hypothetical protein
MCSSVTLHVFLCFMLFMGAVRWSVQATAVHRKEACCPSLLAWWREATICRQVTGALKHELYQVNIMQVFQVAASAYKMLCYYFGSTDPLIFLARSLRHAGALNITTKSTGPAGSFCSQCALNMSTIFEMLFACRCPQHHHQLYRACWHLLLTMRSQYVYYI